MSGPAAQNLKMLRFLCGDRALPNVVLATTRWTDPAQTQDFQEQQQRQVELISKPGYWGDLIHQGATPAHYDGTYASALSIISHLEGCPPVVLDIQCQMVDDGYPLLQTAAGRYLDDDFLKREAELQHQLDEVRMQLTVSQREKNNTVSAEEMEIEKAKIMSRLTSAEIERRRLDVDIAGKSRESNKRIQELAQQSRAPKWRAVAVNAAKGLGFIGPAVLVLMGEPMSAATVMTKAFKLSVDVLKWIFEMVDSIQSML